jgi:dipeptidase E
MWTEAELKDKSTTDFQMFSGIYIGGGNTFKLLKELKDLGVFEILKELSDQNIPIYGGSAGALLCAKSIITAAPLDKNEVGITDLSALNLIQNSHLWVHYEEGMNSMVEKYINDYELEKVIAIPENAGIYVNDNGIEAVGPGNITVFRNNTKTLYKSGDATIIL